MSNLENDLNQINSLISDLDSNNQETIIQVSDIVNSNILEPRRQNALDTLNKLEKNLENTTIQKKQKLQNLLNTANNTAKELTNIKNNIDNLDTINGDKNTTIIDQYDQNNNGNINQSELRNTIIDLVNDELSRNELRQVIVKYVESHI